MNWIAPRLARAVLAVAVTVLLVGIALAAIGVTVASWPYRHMVGPSRRRAQVEAALTTLTALAVLVGLLRRKGEQVTDEAGAPAGERHHAAAATADHG